MRGSSNQYPPQTGAYAVKVKSGAGWRAFDMARLQISVGQPYHEGDKFAATVDWVRHRFDHVIVCVNDTLQRFNHQFDGLDPLAAFERARDDGTAWLDRNGAALGCLPSVEVHRWEAWKAGPDYAEALDAVEWLAANNDVFRAAVHQDIRERWLRRQRQTGLSDAYDRERFFALSAQYLHEETAVFALMFQRTRAVDIYPGSPLLPCVTFQGRKVLGAPKGLDQGAFTRIDFRRNPNAAPRPLTRPVADAQLRYG